MAPTLPKHDAIWVRELVADLKARGLPTENLLAEVGLSEDSLKAEGARIPFTKHAALLELAARMTGDDTLGLHFAQTRDTRDAGLLGYVGLSSPTLMDAIENLARYRRVFSDATDLQLDTLRTDGRLSWRIRDGATDSVRQSVEFMATNWIRAFRDATKSRIVPVSLSFTHKRTENIDEFERFFGCPVRFNRQANSLRIELSDLNRRIVTADDKLLGLLRQYCQDILSSRPEQAPLLVERVERVIADRLADGHAKLDVVAAEVGMSPRSLSRRLSELGTSFNELIEGLRKQIAHRYLHETNLSCTQIAFVLGYSDVSSFNHAFKRWSGETPTAARNSVSA
jgi:AraC-like DNA-binding protein